MMDLQTGVALANCVIVPVAGWLLKNAMGRFTDRLERAEARIEKTEQAIETKVSDEEWLREVMRLRNQVEKMSDKLATLDGKLDSTLQVAMAVNRLADSVDRQTRGDDGEG